MEVIQDIDFTGDININGVTQHYCLDLYVPGDSTLSDTNGSANDINIKTSSNKDLDYQIEQNEMDIGQNNNVYSVATCTPLFSEDLNCRKAGCGTVTESSKVGTSPFVLFIHGGGWRRGDRDAWKHYLYYDVNFLVSTLTWLLGTYGNVGETLAQNGISCAVISYPLTELGMPWIFLEMLASYIQSCLFVFATVFIPSAIFLLFRMTGDHQTFSHWSIIHHHLKATHWKEKVLLTMLVTNLLTALLLTFRRHKFNIKLRYIIAMWIGIVLLSLPVEFNLANWLVQVGLVTFVIVQYTILRLRLKRSGRSVHDQVKVVAMAMKWARDTCRASNISVMGHSAGGHLATLVVSDSTVLEREGLSARYIKGVISVSGIYDVRCLNTPIIDRLYLRPTFGDSEKQWLAVSPDHLVQNKDKNNTDLPPFLLISAEKDLFLKPQSLRFYQTLQERGVDCHHIEIKRTNHFSVIVNFKQSYFDSDFSPVSDVLQFIWRHGV